MIKKIMISNFKKIKKEIEIDFSVHKSTKHNNSFISNDGILSVIGLMGRNASGKSSLLDAINTYVKYVSNNFLNNQYRLNGINTLLSKRKNNESLKKEGSLPF